MHIACRKQFARRRVRREVATTGFHVRCPRAARRRPPWPPGTHRRSWRRWCARGHLRRARSKVALSHTGSCAAADRVDLGAAPAPRRIGLGDVVRAAGDAFQQGPDEVAAVVRQVQAQDHTLGVGIMDGRPLAREVGSTPGPRAPGGALRRLRHQADPVDGIALASELVPDQWVSVPRWPGPTSRHAGRGTAMAHTTGAVRHTLG